MPSLYETTVNTGEVSSSNFTTLYNASGLQVPNAGAGQITGNLNVGGNLTVQGSTLLVGEVTLQSTLSLPNYTFPLPDGSTDQVMVTDGNGNLTWVDVTAIPGADYNISATTATGGANLTLANTAGFTDSVKFAAGTNMSIVRTDANTITISTVADNIPDGTAKGQVLYWDGSAWTANSIITTDASANRLRIVNNVSGGITALDLLKQYSGTLADATTVGQLFGFYDGGALSTTNPRYNHRVSSEYDTTGNPIYRVQADPTGNFQPSSTTTYTTLRLDNDYLGINGNQFILNLNLTADPTEDGVLRVNRGTQTDATLTWSEGYGPATGNDRWEFTNDLFVANDYKQNGQNLTINSDSTAADSYLYLKGATEYLKWNNTDTRFEFSDQLYISQTDTPAILEKQTTTAQASTESVVALQLIERVTDAANNATDDAGPGIQFARTSGASGGPVTKFAEIGANYFGSTNTAEYQFFWSDDNFTETSPGVYPGTYSLLRLGSDNAEFFNNSIYIEYDTLGAARIGINTGTPGETLDVNGSANIQDNLYVVDGQVQVGPGASTDTVLYNNGDVNVGHDLQIVGDTATNRAIIYSGTTGITGASIFDYYQTGTITFGNAANSIYIGGPSGTVYFNNNVEIDGTVKVEGVTLDLTTPVHQGQLLYVSDDVTPTITNSSTVTFGNLTYRPTFQSKIGVSGRTQSGIGVTSNTGATPFTTGDGASIVYAVDSDTQALTTIGSIATAYNVSGDHQIRLATSTNNFANDQATSITGGNTLVFPIAHGFSIGDKLIYSSPTQNGLTYESTYYVISAGFTTTQCQVSTTLGGSAVALTNGTGLSLYFYNGVKRLLNITAAEVDIQAPKILLNATNTGIPFTGTAGIEVERGTSGANQTFAWDETYDFWNASGDLFADNYVIGNVGLATNGNNIFYNNEATSPAGDCNLQVKSGVSAGVNANFRWNDTTKRWQDTTDGTTYLNLPNQNLDTTDDVSFSQVTLDGIATLNTQTTTTTTTSPPTAISSTTRLSQKAVIRIVDNVTGEIHMLEALAFYKGTTAYLTTYAEMYSSAALATFTADVSGGAVRILATPASTNSTTFTVARTSLS